MDESDLSENEILDLNSLKSFEFEPSKTSKILTVVAVDDEEEGAEYKVKQISHSEWCKCSTEAVIGRCSSK